MRTSDFTVAMRGLGEQESQGGKSRTGPANQRTTAEGQHQASFILTLSKKKHQQKTSRFIAPGQGTDNLPLSCGSRVTLRTLVPTHEVFRYEGAWLLPQEVCFIDLCSFLMTFMLQNKLLTNKTPGPKRCELAAELREYSPLPDGD